LENNNRQDSGQIFGKKSADVGLTFRATFVASRVNHPPVPKKTKESKIEHIILKLATRSAE